MERNHILYNVSRGWNVEAKMEDSKYFYFYNDVKTVLSGRKCYVIGRKGTGKTAICQHIINKKEYNHFSIKLSFKAFPFNIIYDLSDRKFTRPNQYITIWKYIIYTSILKMMVGNESVDSQIRTELEKMFPKNGIGNLAKEITDWTSLEFGAQILGTGGNFKIERAKSANPYGWIERTEIMEEIIGQYAGNARYYVVFDELDDDYRDVTQKDEFGLYLELLTSLFKAVQDIKSIFNNRSEYNIMPVIFLRDDIYLHIKDSDKNKWDDMSLVLEWDKEKLKSLLAFRIAQDDPMRKGSPNFDIEWSRIFDKSIQAGAKQRKKISTFDYITNSTLLRPRDFIRFIRECCEVAMEKKLPIVTAEIVHYVDRAFSNYLKKEFRDELFPILPDIDKIFDILSYQRQWIFSPGDFKDSYMREYSVGNIKDPNVDKVLETLYNFSVIGVENKNNREKQYFKYINTNMAYNRYENVVVHRGLFKSLGIE